MQVPCVAPRITGIPELIRDGVDGLLFTAGDISEMDGMRGPLDPIGSAAASVGAIRKTTHIGWIRDIRENTRRFGAILCGRKSCPRHPKSARATVAAREHKQLWCYSILEYYKTFIGKHLLTIANRSVIL